MGRRSIKIDLIVVLQDGFSDSSILQGRVMVTCENGARAIDKGGGCYVYCNLPRGRLRFDITAEKYYSKSFEADIDGSVSTVRLYLSPKSGYKPAAAAAVISGELHEKAEVVFIYPRSKARVMAAAKKGDACIRAVLPTEFTDCRRLYLATAHSYGVFSPKSGSTPTEYILTPPLGFDIDENTRIGEAYSYLPDESGMLYAAAPGLFSEAAVILPDRKVDVKIEGSVGILRLHRTKTG